MIRRYMRVGGTHGSSAIVYFQSNVLQSQTATSVTYLTTVKGAAGSTVTFKVTTLNASSPSHLYQVDGVTYNLGDTFTRLLDGTGHVSFSQFASVGTATPGNGIDVILTITATTNGTIVNPATTNISKTT